MFYLRLERKYKKDLFLVARQLKKHFAASLINYKQAQDDKGDDQNAQYKPLENEKQIKYEDHRK